MKTINIGDIVSFECRRGKSLAIVIGASNIQRELGTYHYKINEFVKDLEKVNQTLDK